MLRYNQHLHANNVVTPRISRDVLDEASDIFYGTLRSPFLSKRDGLQASRMPCAQLQTDLGKFFVVQPGGRSAEHALACTSEDSRRQL